MESATEKSMSPGKKELLVSSIQSNHMFIKADDLSDWVKIKSGSFGVLHKADYLGTDVAVKTFIDISKEEPSYDIQKYIEREVDMLKDARHPNVVQFMGCSLLNNEILLVTEFVCGGTVKEWIQDETRKMSDRLRVSIAMDVAKAMAYLHSRGIIHRDLKTDNLLVTENKRIKVCDFGFSRLAPTTAQEVRRLSFCGTDSYMAPEIILCTPFDHRIDVFSYGIILCELAMDKIAEGSVLSRTVPGFGIQQNEVIAGVLGRVGFHDVEVDIDEYNPRSMDIGVVMRGFLDVAFGCADDDPAMRMEWKTVMRRLKGLETEITKNEKEQGILDSTIANSMSMPSIFSLVGSVSASAGLNKSGNSSRITPEKSAPTLDAISEAGNGEEKADEMPKLDDSMKQASQYNRILQDLSSSSKSEGNMEIAASCPTLDGFSLRSSKKACGSGLQHAIPHKLGPVHGLQIFKLALNRRKCEVCDGSFLKMGDSLKPTKCTECGATFHLGCESNQPPSCGLPRDVRNSLFPANPSFGLSTSSISLFSKLKPSGRVSDGKASTRLVFHAHDGDHFATKEFVDAVNPDIHPPTPPLSRKKKNSGQSSALMKSVNRFSSAGSLGQHVENVDSKNYNYQLYDLQKSRVFGSTRAVSGIETDTLGKKVDFDSKATLNVGASRDLSSVH